MENQERNQHLQNPEEESKLPTELMPTEELKEHLRKEERKGVEPFQEKPKSFMEKQIDLAAVLRTEGVVISLPTNVMTVAAKEAWAKVGNKMKNVQAWYKKFVRDPKTGLPFYTEAQVKAMMEVTMKMCRENPGAYEELRIREPSTLEKVLLNTHTSSRNRAEELNKNTSPVKNPKF